MDIPLQEFCITIEAAEHQKVFVIMKWPTLVFTLFDKDGSESIDSYELKDAMKALGIYVDKESLKKLMEKADKDGSGSIERPEFLSLMAELIERRDPKREVEKSFRMYDEDDGGTIDLGNLRKVVHELGY